MTAQYCKCGKPGCKVCSEERGHGPYYYDTRTVDGKKEIRYFGRKFVDFYYRQCAAEMRMDVHTATGHTSFILRGIDVAKLGVWLKEHTRQTRLSDDGTNKDADKRKEK